MKTLKLVLKTRWFDMIASGEKREEYREIKPYWINIFNKRNYNCVTFYLGYSKDRPSMTFEIESISIGKGRLKWGAELGKEYYVIHLGNRLK